MSRNWTIKDFIIKKKIGDGQYSKVYLAKENIVKKSVALKVIDNNIFGKKLAEEQLQREIRIQHRLKHENILKLFGFFNDDKATYIVLEYCERGEMYKDIKACGGYSNKRAATYTYQLAHALNYCFDQGVIHRDIKTENILISSSGSVKLADFGWSNSFKKNERYTFCGTPEYLSPDVINGEPQNEKVDIWCLGVLLYEMLTKTTPFLGVDQAELYSNITNVKYTVPDKMEILAKYLIKHILRKNIYERLTAKRILIHPYVVRFAEKTLTECKAAIEQWSTLEQKSKGSLDNWSFGITCPAIDFANEINYEGDISIGNKENSGLSFGVSEDEAKKDF